MNVIYFLTEKELLTSIGDMTFSVGGKFWVVFIRRDRAGASLRAQEQREDSVKPLPSSCKEQVNGWCGSVGPAGDE